MKTLTGIIGCVVGMMLADTILDKTICKKDAQRRDDIRKRVKTILKTKTN